MNVTDQVALVPVRLDQSMLAVTTLVPVLVSLALVVHHFLYPVQSGRQASH